ncbi:hypothetical protein A3K82_02015 [Candidatus Pacearchaeota archaeon RBG_19FT_COMBO_34_9]|nr:MAG: hypothetical protein A3K82_02015 [Candidatus Pacearchaeota archaeon RBG_19FT_COMBO_34_9]OGJ15925.1 MAG: hypothetical protein A3K74_02390 [Candidatus Pacearchaeota archaeon RBG_13_33_26]
MKINLMNLFKKKTSIKKLLIIHITHHKSGTYWFGHILTDIAKEFKLKLQICDQNKLKKDTEIWLFPDSDLNTINFEKLNRPYKGTHMIRDPRDKIVSGYFYHLWCDEEWFRKKNNRLNQSFQEILNSINKKDGLLLEIWELRNQLQHMNSCWDYNNPNILEIKYEDVLLNPEKWFPIIFRKWGFEEKDMPVLMEIAKKHHFNNRAKRKLGEEKKGEHLRQGLPGDWKNHFTPKLKRIFKNLFGDWLIKLGYEKDKGW